MEGIDVSEYQGTVDFKKVKKAGKEFVIIRAGIGQRTDTFLTRNVKGCTEAGLPYGLYWFCKATDTDGAAKEADALLDAVRISNAKPELGIWYDIELMAHAKMAPTQFLALYGAFADRVKGVASVGLYANKSMLQTVYNALPKKMDAIPIWLAQYNKEITYTGTVNIWQYSDKGTVDGIAGAVDLNDMCDVESFGIEDDGEKVAAIREKIAQIGLLLKDINELL